MNVDPFTLIQKGDIVKINSLGLSYTGQDMKGLKFKVVQTKIDEREMQECIEASEGVFNPNCTCYRGYDLQMIGQDKVIQDMRFDELILEEIPVDNKLKLV